MNTIDFSTLPNSLKDFSQQNNGKIYQGLFGSGMVYKEYCQQMYGDDEIVLTNFKMKKVIQSGEFDPNDTTCGFTPTPNVAKLGARIMKLRNGKINIKIHEQEIEQMYRNTIGKNRTSGKREGILQLPEPFGQTFFSAVNERAASELGEAMVRGVYTPFAPTNLGIVSGIIDTLKSGIGVDIPATQIMPLVPIDETNAVAQVRQLITLIRQTKPYYLRQKMILICGPKVKDCYEQNFANAYNGGMRAATMQYGQSYAEGYPNIVFQVDENFGESNAMIVTTQGNLAWGTDNEGRFSRVELQRYEYCLKIMIDFKIGFDYVLGEEIWANNLLSPLL